MCVIIPREKYNYVGWDIISQDYQQRLCTLGRPQIPHVYTTSHIGCVPCGCGDDLFLFFFYYLEKSSCVGLTPINGFHSPCKLCMNIDGDNSSESGMLHAHIYWCNLDYRKCNFGHFLVFKECFRYMQCFKLWDNFQNPIARLIAHNGLDILAWEFVGVLNYQNLSSSDLLEHVSIPLIF